MTRGWAIFVILLFYGEADWVCTVDGEEILNAFLQSPSNTKIPAWLQKVVKDYQWFLPRAATSTRELALEILKTTQGNQFCVWHHKHDKGGKNHDSADGPYKVMGTPFPRLSDKMLKKLTTSERSQLLEQRKGFLTSGCPMDVALLDLYLWKTWTASNNTGQSEGLSNQRIDPRTRLFIAEAYRTHAGLVVDDLYTKGQKEPDVIKRRLHAQIQRLATEYDSVAGFHRGKGLIISVCKLNKLRLSYLWRYLPHQLPEDSDREDDNDSN